jgi:hypothetical protein
MQTFITDFNMKKNAENLDNKRLGKQRIEGLQIASILIDKSNIKKGWRNHPAVKMWQGYEGFLLYFYLQWIFHEWIKKCFKNEKCAETYERLCNVCKYPGFENIKTPKWLDVHFIESHRSNLIRKNPEFYKPLFPDTKEGLEYIWPVS